MTTLCFGDVHWSANPRDSYRHDWVDKQLIPLIRAKRVDHVMLLGDLTVDKDRHSAELVNKIVGHISAIASLALLDVVCGNHDYSSAGHPFFEFVNKVENVRWWTAPAELQVHDSRGLGRVLFLPHSHDWERDWPLEDIRRGGHDYIFAHATFAGSQSESGRELAGIPHSIFAPGARVISGDVHVPQQVGPVLCCGAPYTINFGDRFEPRVLLLRGDKIASIAQRGPRKILIDSVNNSDAATRPGDLIKVRAHLAAGEYARWAEIRDGWRAWAEERRVELASVRPVIERGAASAPRTPRRQEIFSDDELLINYGRAKHIDEPTMTVGQELAREV